MKILVLSQYFYPENFRINQLCLELKKRGHEITVITGKPNYPKGEYFPGYSFKGHEDEGWQGINIIRVPLRERKQGGLHLIRNYLSFVYHTNKRVKKIKKEEFDLIYVFEVSPITVALPAIKLKKRINIPIIMNVQDLWPENIIAVTGINNKLLNYFINKLVNYIYKNCDLLLASSPSFVPKISERVTNKSKIKYWPQYSVVEGLKESDSIYDVDAFNIVFTGNIGKAQGLDLAVRAANELKNEKIHWHFIGEGRDKSNIEKLVISLGLDKQIFFYGQKPEDEIPKYLAGADAALLILKPNPIFDMTIPAKLQTYLACGVPILGCISGISKKIINDSDLGLVGNDITTDELVIQCKKFQNLNQLKKNNLKVNALRYSQENFNKDKLLDELLTYMEEMMNGKVYK